MSKAISKVLKETEVKKLLDAYAFWTEGANFFETYPVLSLKTRMEAVRTVQGYLTIDNVKDLLMDESMLNTVIYGLSEVEPQKEACWNFFRSPFGCFEQAYGGECVFKTRPRLEPVCEKALDEWLSEHMA